MLKKCSILTILFLLTSISPQLRAIHTADKTESSSYDLNSRLSKFLDFVKDLHERDLLDGEMLVSRGSETLLNLTSNEPKLSNQAFMIGSISKQFYAVALLKALYESSIYESEELKIADVKDKLQLPLSYFLPENSTIWNKEMPSWVDFVTLHELLSHTSGIPNYTSTKGYEISEVTHDNTRWHESYRSPSEIISLISKESLSFPPGSKYSYCNTGYVLIAEAIEAITSIKSEQYLQKAIFDPIGLSLTSVPFQGNAYELQKDIPTLLLPLKYHPKDDKLIYPLSHYENISVAKGAGSIVSSASDLLKWNLALHKEKSILPNGLYDLFITPNLNNYGYGITIENDPTGTTLGHAGGISSYCSLLLYLPEHDISIVVLSNVSYDFEKIEEEVNELAKTLPDVTPEEKRDNSFKTVVKKYPGKRGYFIIMKKIRKMCKSYE